MTRSTSLPLNRFLYFIKERDSIRLFKAGGIPRRDWTDDPILKEWRFCNINRNDDTETKWVHKNILRPHDKCPYLWFNLCVARVVNWHGTLKALGYIEVFNPKKFIRVLHERRDAGLKVWTGAYIVSTNGHSMDKAEYFATKVLEPLWKHARQGAGRWRFDSVESFATMLKEHNGFSDFMANQVATDFKYSSQLRKAKDWGTFVLAGPGTLRGLNRVMEQPIHTRHKKGDVQEHLLRLRDLVLDGIAEYKDDIEYYGTVFRDMNNLTNCLCEFDKYERVRLNEGQPRARYTPAAL